MSLSFGFASLHEKRRREKLGQRDSKCRASYEGPLRDKSLQGLAKTYNPYSHGWINTVPFAGRWMRKGSQVE
jgi:hypothetical protein